jgi:hypothetical protein
MSKYISNYSQFIVEQDMGMGAAPAAAPKPVTRYKFIFISSKEDEGVSKKKYPDGSTNIQYSCYSVTDDDLTTWVKDNIIKTDKDKSNSSELELRKSNLIEIVKGDKANISNEDLPYLEKLRRALHTNLVGKEEPQVEVVFTKDGIPTTDSIDVTFINSKH